LAAVLENARLLMDLQRICARIPERPVCNLGFIKGQHAPAVLPLPGRQRLGQKPWPAGGRFRIGRQWQPWLISAGDEKTAEQLDASSSDVRERLPESASLIFAAHFMMLKDPKFIDRMAAQIEEGVPATRAVRDVAGKYIDLFTDSPHPYIREKVSDIEDLAGRLLNNLARHHPDGNGNSTDRVVIARALYPSELLKLAAESVAGIVLVNGGVTSHVAIIARSLKIPRGGGPVPGVAPSAAGHPYWWTVRWAMYTWIPRRTSLPVRCPQSGPGAGDCQPKGPGSGGSSAHNQRRHTG
jgi:phosphotransferase system enzyme I (PtsP)